MSKRQLRRHLNQARIVLLRGSDTAELRAGRVRIGRIEPGMIQSVVGFEAQLKFDALDRIEILKKSNIEIIDARAANISPSSWIVTYIIRKILIHAIFDSVARSRLVTIARQVLNTGPGRVDRDVGILIGESDKLRCIEPLIERSFVIRKREVVAAEKRRQSRTRPVYRIARRTCQSAPIRLAHNRLAWDMLLPQVLSRPNGTSQIGAIDKWNGRSSPPSLCSRNAPGDLRPKKRRIFEQLRPSERVDHAEAAG